MKFEEFQKKGVISSLQKTEKEKYAGFHKEAYKDDLRAAEALFTISPRWTIIAGYYAMHDIAKLYLAEQHDLKITGRGVHLAAIIALRKVLSDRKAKEQAIRLLREAEKVYEIFSTHFKEGIIPVILSRGRDEREKSQYYSDNHERLAFEKSAEFNEQIVRPFIELMENMLKNDA
ncbi:MAG: hypothetical protein KJ955_07590 [Nanoarchaeota archaeon]|nr:hypothetical protein [Nanoarchaeota archaeon]